MTSGKPSKRPPIHGWVSAGSITQGLCSADGTRSVPRGWGVQLVRLGGGHFLCSLGSRLPQCPLEQRFHTQSIGTIKKHGKLGWPSPCSALSGSGPDSEDSRFLCQLALSSGQVEVLGRGGGAWHGGGRKKELWRFASGGSALPVWGASVGVNGWLPLYVSSGSQLPVTCEVEMPYIDLPTAIVVSLLTDCSTYKQANREENQTCLNSLQTLNTINTSYWIALEICPLGINTGRSFRSRSLLLLCSSLKILKSRKLPQIYN